MEDKSEFAASDSLELNTVIFCNNICMHGSITLFETLRKMSIIDDILLSSPLSNSNSLIKAFAKHLGDPCSLSLFTQGGVFQHLPSKIFRSLFHGLEESIICRAVEQTGYLHSHFIYKHLWNTLGRLLAPQLLVPILPSAFQSSKQKSSTERLLLLLTGLAWLTCCPLLFWCQIHRGVGGWSIMFHSAELTAECRRCQLVPVLCGANLIRSLLLFKHVDFWGQCNGRRRKNSNDWKMKNCGRTTKTVMEQVLWALP